MGVNFTPQQRKAIDARGTDLLVSAGAGSGKTAVLVQRVIDIITDEKAPVNIDRLLIVTFTKAAAGEMRLKIQNALYQKAQAKPDPAIQRQLTLLPRANICTIHSFCSDVIRSNFHLTDLDPRFKVAEETESDILLRESLDDVMEVMYEDEDYAPAFSSLLEFYSGGRDDSGLYQVILELFRFSRSMPFPADWLRQSCEAYAVPDVDALLCQPVGLFLLQYLQMILEASIFAYQKALEDIYACEGLMNYLEQFESEWQSLLGAKEQLKGGSYNAIAGAVRAITFDRLKPCKRGFSESAERPKALRALVKEQIEGLQKHIFSISEDALLSDLHALYPQITCMAEITNRLSLRYLERKKEKGILDFNDLEQYTVQLLTEREGEGIKPSRAALDLSEQFAYILIDEYQDSNLVQETIFSSIKKGNNVFMVGDVKQSIYRFRNAMPDLFLEKYKSYPEEVEDSRLKVCLYQNFRSRKEILDFVNFIFSRMMSAAAGETDYTEAEFLNYGAGYKEGAGDYQTEIHLVDCGAAQEEQQEEEVAEPVSGAQAQAIYTAQRIRQLLFHEKLQVIDSATGELRPADYRDIVILLRATKNKADVFYETLSSFGIPVYAELTAGFFDATEIRIMLSLLQVIDNPRLDIELVSVLRGPIFSFSENLLLEIRLRHPEGCFYEAVTAYAAKSEECRRFVDQLIRWRKMAMDTSVDQLIFYLYEETGYKTYVSALRNGPVRAGNLMALYQRALQFEQTSFKGLYYFLSYMNRLRANQKDFSAGKALSENQNVVRILSIHKSKGLEYPIVILADCGKRFNRLDLSAPVLMHHRLGIAPDFVDTSRRVSYPTVLKEIMKHRLYGEGLSEEMRILYVALTRAKEKLILIGSVSDAQRTQDKWSRMGGFEKTPVLEVLKSRSYFDLIGPCIAGDGQGMPPFTFRIHAAHEAPGIFMDVEEDKIRAVDEVIRLEGISDANQEEAYVRLAYRYPYLEAGRMRAKIAVTELKHILTRQEEEAQDLTQSLQIAKAPRFLRDISALTAAEKGTAMHLCMQLLDMAHTGSIAEIDGQIAALVRRAFLTQAQADSVNRKQLYQFFASDLGQRMRKSKNIFKEQRFSLSLDASVLPQMQREGEVICLQGIIDCFFEEEDGMVLLDYKTDYFSDPAAAKEKYAVQLSYYARAIEVFWRKPVKEKYVYSFYFGESIKI